MKNISFKRNESVIRGLEIQADKKTKKPRNWDRIVYIVLLFIILFFLIKYIIGALFFIEADGQIYFDNVEIRNTNDCRIVKYYRNVGQEVCIGDSLFSYIPDKPDGTFNNFGTYEFATQQQKKGDVSWSEKEIFQVNEEMKLNNFLIQEKNKLRNLFYNELERIRNEVMLDVLPRNRLDDQITKINQLNYEIEALKGKNNILQTSIAQLLKMKRDLSNNSNSNGNGKGDGTGLNPNGNLIFYSPLEGTITNILKNEFEVALKEETILAIHKPRNIFIKGFFRQQDLKHLAINDVVKLEFPDGSIGKGVIRRFYFTTYRLPEEFQKKYEPTTRSLSADIYPISEKDLEKWKTYWKLGVKITKMKI